LIPEELRAVELDDMLACFRALPVEQKDAEDEEVDDTSAYDRED
jgi:hypothetical protein